MRRGTAWMPILITLAMLAPALANQPERDIVGGTPAPAGKWPDVVALLYGTEAQHALECSGVLIAPTIVLTAGHCVDRPGLVAVVVGSHDLNQPTLGERHAIAAAFHYPRWLATYDIGVVHLASAAAAPPRAIAMGWDLVDLSVGTAGTIVGWGATDTGGAVYPDRQHEAPIAITDPTCAQTSGCHDEVKPAGELVAGGDGRDACTGDSGGPLLTESGKVLAITSRGVDGVVIKCGQGGVYTRAERVIRWVEHVTGVDIPEANVPTAPAINLVGDEVGQTEITANDPVDTWHRYELLRPPAYGRAAVVDGVVRYCAVSGDETFDSIEVRLTDGKNPARQAVAVIGVTMPAGRTNASCDPAFAGCGCTSATAPWSQLPLWLGLVGWLRRRRR